MLHASRRCGCLAALNLAVVRMLYRLRRENKSWEEIPAHADCRELRWRAMRFGSMPACSTRRAASSCPLRNCSNCWRSRTTMPSRSTPAETEHARVILKRLERAPAAGCLPAGAQTGRHRRRGVVGRWAGSRRPLAPAPDAKRLRDAGRRLRTTCTSAGIDRQNGPRVVRPVIARAGLATDRNRVGDSSPAIARPRR